VSRQLTEILAAWGASVSTLVFIFAVVMIVWLGRRLDR
jgi:hypothetical protein